MKNQILKLKSLLQDLDRLDVAIFDLNTSDEDADRLCDAYNVIVDTSADILNKITGGQIDRRTGELMARAKRPDILALIARMS